MPVSADYTVGPGDEVILRAWGSIDVDYRTTVDRNGLLNLPKIGSFNVAGVKASELERHLRAQIGRLYTNFNLSVALGQLRVGQGVRRRPGAAARRLHAAEPVDLLSAVVAAGGPASNGSMRKITLRRDGKALSELDVYEFLVQGDKSKDLQLAAGDVVVFEPAGAARRADRRGRHAGDLRAEERRRSRCATCCAMPAARRCCRIRTRSSSSASTRRGRPRRASSRSSRSTPPAR